MGLNLESDETRKQLDRERSQRKLLAQLEALSEDAAAHIPDEYTRAALDDFLYDEGGLPRSSRTA